MSKKIMKNNLGNKDNFITFASFVCAIMIVGLHSYNSESLPLNSGTRFVEAVFSHGLFTGAVPIFLFISAYLFYRNVNNIKDCFVKQKKRVVSVVMPFFAWSTFYYLVFALGNKVAGISMVEGVDVSFLGVVKGILFYEYCFPLWFLWQLMVYILISPIVFLLLSKRNISIVVLSCLAVLGLLGMKLEADIWGSTRMLININYFAYYFAGCFMAKNNDIFDKIKKFILKLPLLPLILTYLAFGVLGGLVYEEYILTFNKRCIVPIVAIALWALLYKIYSLKNNIKVPEKISTMIIYAIHPFIGLVVGKVLGVLPIPLIVSYFVGFLVCVILSCVTALIMRYIKPIYWVFSGNR